MDLSMKPCTTSGVDRISNLPDEMLITILSLLPTKDAAAVSVLSKRIRHAFRWITNIDLDDSPISHCLSYKHKAPHLRPLNSDTPRFLERFPSFKMFVNNVLQACQSEHVNRFRLGLGGDKGRYRDVIKSWPLGCDEGCFPDLETCLVHAWMCFPLTRSVRELDLFIHVRRPGQLPPEIFTCETLQVLKIDVSFDIDQVSVMPSFRLPNLKVLHLSSIVIPDYYFLDRIVSSCPLLEDLTIQDCRVKHADFITISSPSLRRLFFHIWDFERFVFKNSELVTFDTPNLQYFSYLSNVPYQFSITKMNALTKAEIFTGQILPGRGNRDATFRNVLSLVRAVSNVQHLSLIGFCIGVLDCDKLKGQLPVFHNLKSLALGYDYNRWDRVLLEFLNLSPFLETLAFPQGIGRHNHHHEMEEAEHKFWTTSQENPSCCRSHLKRIVIKDYVGFEVQELDLVSFLLRSALVLEELIIHRFKCGVAWIPVKDKMSIESTLKKLPRASTSCSIKVQ